MMKFIDLSAQFEKVGAEVTAGIQRVLEGGHFIQGEEVGLLEQRLAEYIGVGHCVGVSSGTDALLVSLMAFDIGPGDEVITTPFSFAATGEVIKLLGATPVYVDIDPNTYNLDPRLLESAITSNTKAIIAVSLYGQCADFDGINGIAEKYTIPVIEDGAQSFGATYKGRKSCSLSTIGCTSFFPTKPLGCYGDGGAVFTNDDNLASMIRQIRVHGQDRRYHHARVGINGRLDTIQAAVLLAKLNYFDEEVELRSHVAEKYAKALHEKGISRPHVESWNTSVYAQYTIRVKQRDSVQEKLNMLGVPTAVHYPIPLYRQPAFLQEGIVLPHTELASQEVMSLPMYPYLQDADIESVVGALDQAVVR